jgi:hypothetical protein
MEHTYSDDGTIGVSTNGYPWVIVAHSDMLKGLGARGQYGVFAAKRFKGGDVIGRYLGEILGSVQEPGMTGRVEQMYASGTGSFLMTVDGYVVDGSKPVQSDQQQLERFGRVLFPGGREEYPGSFVHMINDFKGTHRTANVELDAFGTLKALRNIPALDLQASPQIRTRSELVYSYGAPYWSAIADVQASRQRVQAAGRRVVGRQARAAARRGDLVVID